MPRKRKRKLDGGYSPAKKRRKVDKNKQTKSRQKAQRKRKRKLDGGNTGSSARKRIKLDQNEQTKKNMITVYINDVNTKEYELCNKIPGLSYMNAMIMLSGSKYKSESDFIKQWERIGITRQFLKKNNIKISTKIRSKVFNYSCVNCNEKIRTTQEIPDQSHPIYQNLQNKNYYRYTQHGKYDEEQSGKRIYYHRKSAIFGDTIACHNCYHKIHNCQRCLRNIYFGDKRMCINCRF